MLSCATGIAVAIGISREHCVHVGTERRTHDASYLALALASLPQSGPRSVLRSALMRGPAAHCEKLVAKEDAGNAA